MPDGPVAAGRYVSGPPPANLITEFREYTKSTKQPEAFSQLSHTRPDKNVNGHQLLCRIDVPRRDRPGGDFIPCSACGEQQKFSHGWLIWSPDGELRLVGSCCGPKYFGAGRFRAMEIERNQQDREEQDQYMLIENLPKIHSMIADVEQLRSACETFDRIRKDISARLPSLLRTMREIIRHGSVLSVTREKVGSGVGPQGLRSSGGGNSNYETVVLGQLKGLGIFQSATRAEAELGQIVYTLSQLDTCRSEDESLTAVADMDRFELAVLAEQIRTSTERIAKLKKRLLDLDDFLDTTNLAVFQKWCRDPDNNLGFEVTVSASQVLVREKKGSWVVIPMARDVVSPTD